MINNIETLSKVTQMCNKFYSSKEAFYILNAVEIAEAQKSGLCLYYDNEGHMAQIGLHDGPRLLEVFRNYIELIYVNGKAVDHISDSFIEVIISHFIKRYHTDIDNTIGYSSKEMREHFSLDAYINTLKDNEIFEEILEYVISMKDIVYLLDGAGYLNNHDKNTILITHEWIQGEVLIEMVILRGIMKEDQSKYNYFSYGEIDRLLYPANPLFNSHCFDIVKRINNIKFNIKNKEYTPLGLEILDRVLSQLYIGIVTAQFNKKLYQGEIDDFDMLIRRVQKALID